MHGNCAVIVQERTRQRRKNELLVFKSAYLDKFQKLVARIKRRSTKKEKYESLMILVCPKVRLFLLQISSSSVRSGQSITMLHVKSFVKVKTIIC